MILSAGVLHILAIFLNHMQMSSLKIEQNIHVLSVEGGFVPSCGSGRPWWRVLRAAGTRPPFGRAPPLPTISSATGPGLGLWLGSRALRPSGLNDGYLRGVAQKRLWCSNLNFSQGLPIHARLLKNSAGKQHQVLHSICIKACAPLGDEHEWMMQTREPTL